MAQTQPTQPYKGTRDFYPSDLAKRNYIFDAWRMTLTANGFVEYDTSVMENAQLYIAKSGEELGSTQLYAFEDKGGRQVALRPEMTPTLARIVANKYEELKPSFPLRWFSIPNCFRYERPQKGRLREFWQLNADIIGIKSGPADLEMLILLGKMFQEFGATKKMYSIRYNNREWLDTQINLKVKNTNKEIVYKTLDDWRKISDEDKREQLGDDYDAVLEIINSDPSPVVLANHEILAAALPNVDIQFDPTIVRGLAYYTGLVFECFDNNPDNNRAMFGGGRYDDLMDLFGKEQTPCVGVGVGDVTWSEFLDGWNLWPKNTGDKTELVGIMLTPSDTLEEEKEKLNKLHTETIPELQAEGKTYIIDYNTTRSENKRYKSLKKQECGEIISV